MTRLFRRRAILQVDKLVIDSRDGLDFRFNVDRSTRKEPNTAQIDIYNLAKDRREQLERKKDVVALLEVGYEDSDTFEIFRGNVRYGTSKKERADIITKVESGDGEKTVRGSRTGISFERGISSEEAVKKIRENMGVGEGNLVQQIKDKLMAGNTDVFEHGAVFEGSGIDELNKVLESHDLEASIQGEKLQVTKRGKGLEGKPVLLTSRFEGRPEVNEQGMLVFSGAGDNTGLIGSPSVDSEGIIEAKALIMPGLNPGKRVKIQSQSVEAIGVVKEAQYTGSTFGSSWEVMLKLEPERA